MECYEFIQSYKRRINVKNRCKFPKFCDRYKIDIGIYDPKSKKLLARNFKPRDICVHVDKNQFCVNWKKNRRDSLLNGVGEIERIFKNVKSNINEINLKQRIRYCFPKNETKDQLQNVFVFDLETNRDQDFAKPYAAGLYDVNRLQDKWDRDLTPDEIVREEKKCCRF